LEKIIYMIKTFLINYFKALKNQNYVKLKGDKAYFNSEKVWKLMMKNEFEK